jgi:hypothetical protein
MKKGALIYHGPGVAVCRIVVYSDGRDIHWFDNSQDAADFELRLNAAGIELHDGAKVPSREFPLYDQINFATETARRFADEVDSAAELNILVAELRSLDSFERSPD